LINRNTIFHRIDKNFDCNRKKMPGPWPGIILGIIAITIAILGCIFAFLAFYGHGEGQGGDTLQFVTNSGSSGDETVAVPSSRNIWSSAVTEVIADGSSGRFDEHMVYVPAGTFTKAGDILEWKFWVHVVTNGNDPFTVNTGTPGGTSQIILNGVEHENDEEFFIEGFSIFLGTNIRSYVISRQLNNLNDTQTSYGDSVVEAGFDGSTDWWVFVIKGDTDASWTMNGSIGIFHPSST